MKSSGDNLAPLVFKYQIKKEKLVFHVSRLFVMSHVGMCVFI